MNFNNATNFKDFIRQGKVRKGEKDFQKAKALLKMSESNYKTIAVLLSTSESASTIFSILYESLREVIEAVCVCEGYGVYSHEAFTLYLQEKKEERIAAIFDRYRKLRNGIHYYGKGVSVEVAEEAKLQVKKIMGELKKKYLISLQ